MTQSDQQAIQQIDLRLAELQGYRDAHERLYLIYLQQFKEGIGYEELQLLGIILYLEEKGWSTK